jgi:hypothetical protein
MDGKTKVKRTLTESTTVIKTIKAQNMISINIDADNTINTDTALHVLSTTENSENGLICLDCDGFEQTGICMTNYNDNEKAMFYHLSTQPNWNANITGQSALMMCLETSQGTKLECIKCKRFNTSIETDFGDINTTNNLKIYGGIETNDDLIINGNIEFTGNMTQNGSIYPAATSGGGGGSSVWTTSGSNIYYDSGNIAVGLTNPITPLHIISSANWQSSNYTTATFENSNEEAMIEIKSNPGSTTGSLKMGFHGLSGNSNQGIGYFYLMQGNSRWSAIEMHRSSNNNGTFKFGNNINSYGSIVVAGDIDYTGSLTDISDGRFKKNQQEVNYKDCYEKIKKIKLKKYDWDIEKLQKEVNKHSDADGSSIIFKRPNNELGFIAQELEQIIPNAVKTSEKFNITDFKSVEYNRINLILFGAVKQLMNDNELMKKRIEKLEDIIG